MNQEKIGKFIAELRKEQGLTQQQLADALGVSNKTISKWECGNGMPELSLILPLCETLGISINELLSGERLTADGYSKRAEENIMSLIKEKESLKRNHNSLSTIVVTIITTVVAVWYSIRMNLYSTGKGAFFDSNIILAMVIPTVLFLIAAKLGKSFFLAFKILANFSKEPSSDDIKKAHSALSLASNTLLGMGALLSVVQFSAIMYENTGSCESPSLYLFYWASFGILYGLISFLFFLPFKARLQTMTLS